MKRKKNIKKINAPTFEPRPAKSYFIANGRFSHSESQLLKSCATFTCLLFIGNGEHNVLRAMGYTRPVSVLRIKSEVKARYSRMSVKKLCAMITPNGMLHHALIYM